MVLKSTWASGEVLTAANFNEVATDINTLSNAVQFATNVTANGTTTLTVASAGVQEFTGTANQTVVLPTTSVLAGERHRIINNSTGAVTVQSSNLTTVTVLATNTSGLFIALVATPTAPTHWDAQYFAGKYAAGKAVTFNNSLTLAGTDATTMTFPGASDTVVTLAAAQALTSKTLTTPTLTTPVITGTVTGTYTLGGTPTFPTLNQNTTGTAANVTGTVAVANGGTGSTSLVTAATASSVAARDANANLFADNFISVVESTATAAGTTTLTIASGGVQVFTGSLIQTVVLPSTSVTAGMSWTVINQSTNYIQVASSLGNSISTPWPNGRINPSVAMMFTATAATPTTAAHWRATSLSDADRRTIPRIGTVASAAAPAINTDLFDQFNITALATAITSMSTNLSGQPADGQKLTIRITGDATPRAITWGSGFINSGVATLPTTTVASKTHLVGLIYDESKTKWVCAASDVIGY
jgi:hypothetical protein